MSTCNLSIKMLHAWHDSAPDRRDESTSFHVETCPACQQRVHEWQQLGTELRRFVDAGVPEVEPLIASQAIHRRIRQLEESSWLNRLSVFWRDLWIFHRSALTGATMAMALGAVVAPVAVWMIGEQGSQADFQVAQSDTGFAGQPTVAAFSGAHAERIALRLRVVYAHGHSGGKTVRLQRELSDLRDEFQALAFDAYDLQNDTVMHLVAMTANQVLLPSGQQFNLMPRSVEADGSLVVDIDIKDTVPRSTLVIKPGTTALVPGPTFEQGALILVLSR